MKNPQNSCYNILLVVNQKYFELAKICIHSILKNVEVDKIICIYVANIGLEDNAVNYFKTLSTKIAVVDTGISTAYTKDRHTKEWVEAVSQKTRILRQLADNGNNLPLVVMDVDQVVLDDFSHVLDHSKDIQVCKREVPAQRPDMVMDYIGSFFVVNNYIALPFLDRWIERIGERITEGTIPAYETPALCEIIDEFKDKLAIGELSENVVSCNNNFIEGITRIIHMKSETAAESADLVQGRVGGVSNYNHRDILKYIYGDELYNNFLRQNLTGVSCYINIGVREQSQIQALLSDKPAVKYLDYEDLMQKTEGPLDSYASAVVEIQLEDYDSDLDGLIHELSLAVIDLRLFLNVDVKTEVSRAMRIIKYMMESGYCVYFFEEQNQLICKVKDLTDLEHISTKSHSAKLTFYCHHQSKSFSFCYFLHSSFPGGADRSAFEAVKNLISKYGAVPTVIMPTYGLMDKWYANIGVPVITIDYCWWTVKPFYSVEQITSSMLSILKQKDMFEKINPAIIMTQTMVIPWGAFLALLLKKPHIWNIREYGEIDHGIIFYYPLSDVINMIIDFSEHITTCGKKLKEYLFSNITSNLVSEAYARVDVKYPLSKSKKTDLGKLILIIPGSIVPSKGQLEAVLAISELVIQRNKKEVQLILIGNADNVYLEDIKYIIKKNNLKNYVDIKDFNIDIYKQIDSADIVLSCSKLEAFGRVPMEGLLLSKPVIASNTGGNTEIIINGVNGFLYESGNHLDLADKIEIFIEHPEELKRMGDRGPESLEKALNGNYIEDVLYDLSMKIKDKTVVYDGELLVDAMNSLVNIKQMYLQTLFINTGKGFNSSECMQEVTVLSADNKFSTIFELQRFSNVISVRFDPLEGMFCKVKLCNIKYINKSGVLTTLDITQVTSNGFKRDNEETIFATIDPMYYFPISGEIMQIEISGEMEILDKFNTEQLVTQVLKEEYQGIKKLSKKLIRQIISKIISWLAIKV